MHSLGTHTEVTVKNTLSSLAFHLFFMQGMLCERPLVSRMPKQRSEIPDHKVENTNKQGQMAALWEHRPLCSVYILRPSIVP